MPGPLPIAERCKSPGTFGLVQVGQAGPALRAALSKLTNGWANVSVRQGEHSPPSWFVCFVFVLYLDRLDRLDQATKISHFRRPGIKFEAGPLGPILCGAPACFVTDRRLLFADYQPVPHYVTGDGCFRSITQNRCIGSAFFAAR